MDRFITVTRSFTYDTEKIRADYKELNKGGDEEITDDEVMALIIEWSKEDLMSPVSRHEIAWFGDYGELDL